MEGYLQKNWGRMLKQLGVKLSASDVKGLVYEFDKDGSRDIDLAEFRELISSILSADKTYKEAYEAFKFFDKNGDQTITRDELKEACDNLSNKLTEQEIDDLVTKNGC